MQEKKKQNYTPAGYQALLDELEEQKQKQEQNKKDISTARSYGDLSENSEYDEAKNEQGKIAQRIQELEELIKNAHVIDESQIDSSIVGVGSIVVVLNKDKNTEKTYHIVGSFETDPFSGKISDVSPIGAALMGARAGDEVEATLPNGNVLHLEVKEVKR